MLWYIMVCSMIGGISVSVTTGLGSAIVTTAMGDNQVRRASYLLARLRAGCGTVEGGLTHGTVQTLVYLLPYRIRRCNIK